jgi:hypothetical protein
MKTLNSNDFVYEDDKPSPSLTPSSTPLESTVSSAEPKTLSDFEIEEEPSLIKDLARLGVQGASMSFSDEALAGLQAAADVAGTEKTLKDLPALYEQYKQIERRKIEEARERSPILGTAAEIGGAIIPSIFTGGTSLAVKGAAKFLPSLATSTSAGASIGRAALTGAQYGGVAAAGAMESPLLSSEGATEIAKGATMGSLFGGAMAGAGEAAKGIYKAYAPESRAFKLAGVATKEAFEGRPSPTSTAGELLLQKEEQAAAKGFSEKWFAEGGLRDIQGKAIQTVTEKATEEGIRIGENPNTVARLEDLTNLLLNKGNKFNEKERAAVSDLIEDFAKNKGIVRPDLANAARRILPDIRRKLADKEPIEVLNTLDGAFKALTQELTEKVPNFAEANLRYRKSLGVPEVLLGKRASKIEDVAGRTEEKARTLISRAEVLGETGVKAREKLNKLKTAAKQAFDLDPESFKKVGINSSDELFTQIEKQAERASIRQGLGGVDRGPGKLGKIEALLNVVHPYQLGRYAGGIAKKVTDVSSWTYKQPDAVLSRVAEKMAQYPSLQGVANSLRSSVESGNVRMKNATLFAILQKPEARAILGEEAESEQETE